MSIKGAIMSLRIGLKAGLRATDKLIKLADGFEKEANAIQKAIAAIKEITPDDEDESENKD